MDGPERHWGIRALEFVDAINAATTQADVTALFQKTISECGLHAYVIGWLTNDGDRVKDHLFANGWPVQWADLYMRERFVEHDPIPRHGFRSIDPFEWSDAPFDSEREPLAKTVMDRARDFKMDKGFFVPIHFGDRASGGVSLAGERPEFEPGVKPALHLMSLYAHSRIRSFIEGSEPLPPVLTAREREVLQWTAAGKSSWEIGAILSISERTVNFHVRSAMAKLDSVNRIAAVVAALRRREINL
jgi:LuxR family quorum sensing-dependent transcriptional regulator